jgi:tetratricopeptide (TPR) repeat protein
MIRAAMEMLGKGQEAVTEMLRDYKDLEERNQKELDRLMKMLEKDPLNALKYAIPLDESGTNRGRSYDSEGEFKLSRIWSDFSLFGSSSSSGGGGGNINLGDNAYNRLQEQYNKTAEQLIKQGEHQKAAFVYLKLLKNPYRAAEVLREGKRYQEAASIYLKYQKDELQAAACYEEGRYYKEAIPFYIKHNKHEKAGDLYQLLGEREEALGQYAKVTQELEHKGQYLEAAKIYRDKMQQPDRARSALLLGWKTKNHPVECLTRYLQPLDDQTAWQEAQRIYHEDVSEQNRQQFYQVLKNESPRRVETQEEIREMSYQIISVESKRDPSFIHELKYLNPKDKQLVKDTIRFKLKG